MKKIIILLILVVLIVFGSMYVINFKDNIVENDEYITKEGQDFLDRNEEIELSVDEKSSIEEYINKILNYKACLKVEEFDDINNASKEWIYSHLDYNYDDEGTMISYYLTKDEIENQLISLFGKDLRIDVDKDASSSDSIDLPRYEERFDKEGEYAYFLSAYGLDSILIYDIDTIQKYDDYYVVNVVEHDLMEDRGSDTETPDFIISAFDDSLNSDIKIKEIFRVKYDTSKEEITKEVVRRKAEFQSYDVTIVKDENELYFVKKIEKVK